MQATRSCLAGAALAAAVLAPAGSAHAQLYGRLDTGMSWAADAGMRRDSPRLCGNAACTVPGELDDAGRSAVVQAGAGWRFSPNLRTDLTLGYRGWYELDDHDHWTQFKADIKSWSLLANAYRDFTLAAFRPYLGAGIGWARNKVDPVTLVVLPLNGTAPGGSRSGFAWALMAGVAWPAGPRLTFDIGYRYVDLGKVGSNAGDLTLIPALVSPTSGFEGNLRAHEITLGLRF